MQTKRVTSRVLLSSLLCTTLASGLLWAEAIPVRFREGSLHGFLTLRSLEGELLAAGDLTQSVRGNTVTSRLVFRFQDGSLDDETAIFSQQPTFRLLKGRHIQKGPSFPHPMDMSIDVAGRNVIVRYRDKEEEKVATERLDLPADLANGLVINILKNLRPEAGERKVSYLAATPKPRLVKLAIAAQGEEAFSAGGHSYKATLFVVKVELGGVTGIVAPLVGKKPTDIKVWVLGGANPVFVKAEQSLYPEGPIWRIELASPVWPKATDSSR